MSLDIYATLKEGTIPSGQQLGTGYRTWSREERDKHTEPTKEVLWINLTHNLAEMAEHIPVIEAVGTPEGKNNAYYLLWRPEEFFNTTYPICLEVMQAHLEAALYYMLRHEETLSQYNPDNGWGHYENLVYCLPQYIRACYKWPEAIVTVDR